MDQHPNEPSFILVKTEHVQGYLNTPPCNQAIPASCTVQDAIRLAAQTYNVPHHRLLCLARRESTYNPSAYNRAGPYMGLFQFDQQTWRLTPYAHRSVYDEYAAASAAAYLIARGESRRWPPYVHC